MVWQDTHSAGKPFENRKIYPKLIYLYQDPNRTKAKKIRKHMATLKLEARLKKWRKNDAKEEMKFINKLTSNVSCNLQVNNIH